MKTDITRETLLAQLKVYKGCIAEYEKRLNDDNCSVEYITEYLKVLDEVIKTMKDTVYTLLETENEILQYEN